jgi:N-carbamoyl-L-amino-acid hydrolase
VRRLALTGLDRQGRDLVAGWLREADAIVEIDNAGNMFATPRRRDHTVPRS